MQALLGISGTAMVHPGRQGAPRLIVTSPGQGAHDPRVQFAVRVSGVGQDRGGKTQAVRGRGGAESQAETPTRLSKRLEEREVLDRRILARLNESTEGHTDTMQQFEQSFGYRRDQVRDERMVQ